jgi:hypothetical protein
MKRSIFGGTGVGAQGLTLALPLELLHQPFLCVCVCVCVCVGYFLDRVLFFFF